MKICHILVRWKISQFLTRSILKRQIHEFQFFKCICQGMMSAATGTQCIQKITLRARGGPGGQAFLSAVPQGVKKFTTQQWRTTVKFLLNLPLPYHQAQCVCKAQMDDKGEHAMKCTTNRGWAKMRHDELRDAVISILRQSGASVKVEPSYQTLGITPHRYNQSRNSTSPFRRMGPDGWINFMEDKDGATITFDITHSYPFKGSDQQKDYSAKDDEYLIREKEKRKRRTYADLVEQGQARHIGFIPLVSLTHGRWNMEMKKILQQAAASWMTRQGVPENSGTWNRTKSVLMTQWWQELSSRLQKGNIRVLQEQYNKALRGTRERRDPGGDIRNLHVSDATHRTNARTSSQIISSIGSILQAVPSVELQGVL